MIFTPTFLLCCARHTKHTTTSPLGIKEMDHTEDEIHKHKNYTNQLHVKRDSMQHATGNALPPPPLTWYGRRCYLGMKESTSPGKTRTHYHHQRLSRGMENAVASREHSPLVQRPVAHPPPRPDPHRRPVREAPVLHVERALPPHDARVPRLAHTRVVRNADVVAGPTPHGRPSPLHREARRFVAVGHRGEFEDNLGERPRRGGGRARRRSCWKIRTAVGARA